MAAVEGNHGIWHANCCGENLGWDRRCFCLDRCSRLVLISGSKSGGKDLDLPCSETSHPDSSLF
jgi:hypothetical protein